MPYIEDSSHAHLSLHDLDALSLHSYDEDDNRSLISDSDAVSIMSDNDFQSDDSEPMANKTSKKSFFGSFSSSASRSAFFGRSPNSQSKLNSVTPPQPSPTQPEEFTLPQAPAVLTVVDDTLIAIGLQIRQLEEEAKLLDARAAQEVSAKRPELASKIKSMEKNCNEIRSQITAMEKAAIAGQPYENIVFQLLEAKLKEGLAQLECLKKQYHLPFSELVLGEQGVYVGCQDIWLARATGEFDLRLNPAGSNGTETQAAAATAPNIAITVNNMSLLFKVEAFKLVGDSGKRIPKIQFDNLILQLSLSITIVLEYDVAASKWTTTPQQFKIQVLSFKGPYGLNRSIVSGVVSMVVPIIRNLVMDSLPCELGKFISSLRRPLVMEGEFDISGIDLVQLSTDITKSTLFKKLSNYNDLQLKMFLYLQRSLHTTSSPKIMTTISDVIRYIHCHKKHTLLWPVLVQIWSTAFRFYTNEINERITKSSDSYDDDFDRELIKYPILFENILSVAQTIASKTFDIDFKLSSFGGEINIKNALNLLHGIDMRLTKQALEKTPKHKKQEVMQMMESKITMHTAALKGIDLVCDNCRSAEASIVMSLTSGTEGSFLVKLENISVVAPLKLQFPFTEPVVLGKPGFLPFVTVVRQGVEAGQLAMEVLHSGGDERHPLPGDSEDDGKPTRDLSCGHVFLTSASDPEERGRLMRLLFDASDSAQPMATISLNRPSIQLCLEQPTVGQLFGITLGPNLDAVAGVAGEDGDRGEEVGCSISVVTAPHAVFVAEVPSAKISVHLAELARFIAWHFTNIQTLHTYLIEVCEMTTPIATVGYWGNLAGTIFKYLLRDKMLLVVKSCFRVSTENDQLWLSINAADNSSDLQAIADLKFNLLHIKASLSIRNIIEDHLALTAAEA